MKSFITFLLLWRMIASSPMPQEEGADPPAEDKPAEGDGGAPDGAPAGEGGETTQKPAGGAASPDDKASEATTPAGGGDAENPGQNEVTTEGEMATLTLGPDDEMPPNVATDRYGAALTTSSILDIEECKVKIFTEQWVTRYTVPPTKPNCLCLTRGPLPNFKLFGNIHFKYIKQKTPPRYTTSEITSTVCPPCDCEKDCFTSARTTPRRVTIC